MVVSPFLFLAVDLPPPPLFQDAVEKNIIPQASIHSVLAKYDGKTTQVNIHIFLRIMTSLSLPCLIGISGSIATIQMSGVTSVYYIAFQEIYKECIRGRKESDHRQFSPTGSRLPRMYVESVFSLFSTHGTLFAPQISMRHHHTHPLSMTCLQMLRTSPLQAQHATRNIRFGKFTCVLLEAVVTARNGSRFKILSSRRSGRR